MTDQNILDMLDEIRRQTQILESIAKGTSVGPNRPSPASRNAPGETREERQQRKAARELGNQFDDLADSSKGVTVSFDQLARRTNLAMLAFAKQTLQMSNNLSSLKPAISAVSNVAATAVSAITGAVGNAVSTLSLLGGPITKIVGTITGGLVGAVGTASAELIKAAGEGAGLVLEQMEAISNNYTAIAQLGGATARGMTDLYESVGETGIRMEQWAALVGKHSEKLAFSFGSVGDGLLTVNQAAEKMRKTGITEQFLRLGVGVDEQASALASYSKMHSMNSRREKLSVDQLIEGTQRWYTEIDQIARATGKSREAINESVLAQQRSLRWGATMEILNRRQTDLGNKLAASFEKVDAVTGGTFVTDALRDIFSGGRLGKEAQSLMTLAGQDIIPIVDNIKRGLLGADEGMSQIVDAIAKRGGTGAINLESLVGNQLAELGEVLRAARLSQNFIAAGESLDAYAGKLKDSQQSVIKGNDLTTNNIASTQEAVMDIYAEIQKAFSKVLPSASTQIANFADVISEKLPLMAQAIDDYIEKLTGNRPVSAFNKQMQAAESARRNTATVSGTPETGQRGTFWENVSGKVSPENVASLLSDVGITNTRAQANILAQLQAESGFRPRSENLQYSGKKLFEMYGPNQTRNKVRFNSLAEAEALSKQGPEAIGNVIYGGRMGNAVNEGFLYRGRGLIQLTGKDNYAKYGRIIGEDLVNNPDLANDPQIAKKIAVAYMQEQQKAGVNLADIQQVGKAMGFATNDQASRAALASDFEKRLQRGGFRDGGISTGPMTGYTQLLHGTEAIVPLPDGKTIPVDLNFSSITRKMTQDFKTTNADQNKFSPADLVKNLTADFKTTMAGPLEKLALNLNSIQAQQQLPARVEQPSGLNSPELREMNAKMTEQMSAMNAQISKLTEVVDILRRSNATNEKLLQAARN